MPESGNPRLRTIVERHFGLVGQDADAVLESMSPVHLAGGEWLFRQNDGADALYLLVRGRLQVWIDPENLQDEVQEPKLVGEVAPGDCVGEIGLLTGGVRTAGIRAIRDSVLLKLDKPAFMNLAQTHAGLGVQLAGSIALTLAERTRNGADRVRRPTTVAIVPLHGSDAETDLVYRLIEDLGQQTSTLCLSRDRLESLGAPVAGADIDDAISAPLVRWLDDQESRHSLMLYVAEPDCTSWSRLCVRQADMIFLLTDAAADPRPAAWEKELLESDRIRTTKRALLLRHSSSAAQITGTRQWLDARHIGFHLHLRQGQQDETGRLARILLGEANGLVLGGGAARGFAEIGAYRALHEAGVPVDWIGGTSIGGILGAAIAQDEDPDTVLEGAREAFVKGRPFGDYTLPILSLLRGRRMERLTQSHFRGEIEDLRIPFFCVSTRLDDGELFVHERGSVWRALRATAALPGMLTPAVIDRRLVIDGAVLNNLPVDIMQKKPVGTIIAVDVSSRRTFTVDYDKLPSPWTVVRDRLRPGQRQYRVPGVLSILMKSAEIGTAARMRDMANRADLLIRPPVDKFGLTDVRNFDRIVEAGYRHTADVLERWLNRD
ncbi:MAG: cyclic nucleotide-binding and patatin-like phospholipase domain-containing protein [Woeseiaceae bacterium]|nr:cyclic nucleotide-binding and patatin-like phospholipase domain-containing protein [Woeseiaceae bacterium]